MPCPTADTECASRASYGKWLAVSAVAAHS